MTVLVSGASGMIGRELVRQLREDGHSVRTLVRRQPSKPDEVNWAPQAGILDESVLEDVDAVVNLSGASISRIPWTSRWKREILQSRVQATRTITDALTRARTRPKTLLNASAVGFYGNRPGERLTEASPAGTGFLAEVVRRWEETAALAPEGVRVVTLRTGLVVGRGGAFEPILLASRAGLGARMGTGGQHWPWISLHDEAAAIRHLLTSRLSGPVNLAGPVAATSDRATRTVARRLRRWYSFVIPERAISLGLGEAGRELLLPSQRQVPQKLLDDGFRFEHETIEQAIDAMLDRGA